MDTLNNDELVDQVLDRLLDMISDIDDEMMLLDSELMGHVDYNTTEYQSSLVANRQSLEELAMFIREQR